MALANKDRMPNDSTMAIIQASAFYEQNFGSNSSPEDMYGICENPKSFYREPEGPEKASGFAKNFTISNSSSVSSPSSTNSNGLGYQATAYGLSEEGHSVISFKPDYGNFIHGGTGSLLSFEQTKRVRRNLYPKLIGEDDEFPVWEDNLHHPDSYQAQLKSTTTANHGLPETSTGVQFAWLNDEDEDTITNGIQELGRQETGNNNKRPSMGEINVQALKKQCVFGDSKKPKSKSVVAASSISKDPQSVAAKNRRERISERLKILQDLVPNGSKVDLVTMLEKAISYVKFLQLQVKVLAADEFWPVQGGKAPDLSQVREAIDAILASQRDRNSSSK